MAKVKENRPIVVKVQPPCCPVCGSTDRTNYHCISYQDHGGTTTDGREFNRIKRQRTECLSCGQSRVEMVYELVGFRNTEDVSDNP